jgi:hypothetical protein
MKPTPDVAQLLTAIIRHGIPLGDPEAVLAFEGKL